MTAQGFYELKVPDVGSEQWSLANQDAEYFVETKGTASIVRKASPKEVDVTQITYQTNGVKYIGVDDGEFGGGLYLNSYDAKKAPYMKGNIRALIPIGKDLYILEGLAHMGINRGSIHVIRNCATPSRPERMTLLPSAPEAVLVEAASNLTRIVIVGSDSLMIFWPDDLLEMLHQNAFWYSLYPTSIVKDGSSYLIGIRSGIAVVTGMPFGRSTVRYFRPKKP